MKDVSWAAFNALPFEERTQERHDEWIDARINVMGEDLAFAPDRMACFRCGVERKVIALGGIVEAHRDPTQTYELECGHTVI